MEHKLVIKDPIIFESKKVINGNGQSVWNLTKSFLLMHPSMIRKLEYIKGCLVLLHTEKGQLLFHCWPCPFIQPDNIMIPSMSIFQTNLKGNVFTERYNLNIDAADSIILSSCDEQKSFMNSKSFQHFLQTHLDNFYLKEGLILNIFYLGYLCIFIVKNINNSTKDGENEQFQLEEICKNISSLDISENSLIFDESSESTIFCSTPNAAKYSSSKSILGQRMNAFSTDFVKKQENFYLVHSKTIIRVESIDNSSAVSNHLSLLDLVGLEVQISKMKSLIESVLNQDTKDNYGIILVGASGTGKTSMIKAIQKEYKLPVFNLNSYTFARNEIDLKYELQNLFKEAIDNSPSILFLDDVDSFFKNRNFSVSKRELMTSYLSSMIYYVLNSKKDVIVISAAQNISEIHSALRKCGTLEKEIFFGMPSAYERKMIMEKILNNMRHNLDYKEITEIAEMTHGFTGGDLKLLCDKGTIHSFHKAEGLGSCITFEDLKETLKDIKPSAVAEFRLEKPNVKWSDIGGMQGVKDAITEMVDWPLKHAEQFKKFKITPARGILLYGPPGCSKTMIAKALVTESHLNFISIKGPQLFNKYVGESEKSVSELFKKARSAAPCVLFFDEIDSLASIRGSTSGNSNVSERILTQLLIEIDGIDVLQGVSIIAATNRPDMIDPSFLRPGRFDQMIYVSLPDAATRKEILEVKLKNMPISTDVDIAVLVEATKGYTGAEITDVCREAAMSVIKEYITSSASLVAMNHFLTALQSVQPRTSKKMIEFYEIYCKRNSNVDISV